MQSINFLIMGLSYEQTKLALPFFTELKLEKEQVVFKEGDTGGSMFIVESGRVAVFKGEIQIGAIIKGNSFGEMSLLDGRPRSATCIADDESTTLLKINADGMRKLIKEHPTISSKLYETIACLMAGRLRRANDKLAEILWAVD
jgi:CRP-like cAMP-binding protein